MENVNDQGAASFINFADAQAQQVRPVNCDVPMGVTSMNDLVAYAKGTVIRLPDFTDGQPFVARVRRPSLLALAKFGKIPNSLLSTAGSLFSGDGNALDSDNEDMLANVYDVCEVLAKASLIEPRFEDLQQAGIELTDEQMMALMNYSQGGVSALESFRENA